jgi:hypothetical protein
MPKTIDLNEFYFEECPLDEADECCFYEYARESKAQREIIAQWRREAKENRVEDYFELSLCVFDPPPNTGTYAYFPSWPLARPRSSTISQELAHSAVRDRRHRTPHYLFSR